MVENKRLALYRRQSYRIIPIRKTSTNEKTVLTSLYTKNMPEETLDHETDETDITSNPNLSMYIFNTINFFF